MTDPGPVHEGGAVQEGVVTGVGDDHVLRFERLLRHPVGKVWAALTDPEECARWLGHLGHTLVQDGPFALSADGQEIATGTVTELVAPDGEAAAVVECTYGRWSVNRVPLTRPRGAPAEPATARPSGFR